MHNKNSILISAISSNQGKTLLTTALLYHYKEIARGFKVGPDYIDPQFHKAISNTYSINLDSYLMNEEQIRYIYHKYSNKQLSIIEGVMGYYDGMDKGASSYDVAKILNLPTVLLLDGSGTYITLLAIIKGMREFRDGTNIKGIILNKISSKMHYNLIKENIKKEFCDIEVLGYIPKDLDTISAIHLGLDLENIKTKELDILSQKVLENIDLDLLYTLSSHTIKIPEGYPFEKIYLDKKIAIVNDDNFSFLYHDNYQFLKESFKDVVIINATNDEVIDDTVDIVYIVGGYVETNSAYQKIKNANNFRQSLINHSKTKPIYAECAGMILLSTCIDDKQMCDILPLKLKMSDKRVRLGYYIATNTINNHTYKGHSFHYSDVVVSSGEMMILAKGSSSSYGGYKKNNIVGTYLHTMLRSEVNIIKDFFDV